MTVIIKGKAYAVETLSPGAKEQIAIAKTACSAYFAALLAALPQEKAGKSSNKTAK